jgi:uncharacterized protein (TIGR02117 family)
VQKLKKLGKFLVLLLLGICTVATIGVFTPTKWIYGKQNDCSVTIYVSNVNNFHAELILPVSNEAFDWRQQIDLQQLGVDADSYRYLSFGWGDRHFFMNASFDPITIFDVLFVPGPSVMHVWGHTTPKLQLGKAFELKQIKISQQEYLQLTKFISSSFQRSADRQVSYIKPGFYKNSGFYEAIGNYSLFRTCNNWTAEALRVADINTPQWAALAPAVTKQLNCDCGQAQ